MTADEFRRLALELPDAAEAAHMDHPDFRIRGKIFATLGPDEQWGMVNLTADEQASFIRAHSADQITILAFTAPSCTDAPTAILLASWADPLAADGFWVFVNTNRHRTVIRITDRNGGEHSFACEPAEAELTVVFDQRCRVDLPPAHVHAASIERTAGLGSRLPAVNLPVRW